MKNLFKQYFNKNGSSTTSTSTVSNDSTYPEWTRENTEDADQLRTEPSSASAKQQNLQKIKSVFFEAENRAPLEIFKDFVEEATRAHIKQEVNPYFKLENCFKYHVTGLQIYIPKDSISFVKVIDSYPRSVLNKIAKTLIENTPGAKEQLIIDDKFYGLSIELEPDTHDGKVVKTHVIWKAEKFEIKYQFFGEQMWVEQSSPHQDDGTHPSEPIVTAIPITDSNQINQKPNSNSNSNSSLILISDGDKSTSDQAQLSGEEEFDNSNSYLVTEETSNSKPFLINKEIALLRLILNDGNEHSILLTENQLPFVIGRNHQSTTKLKNGISINTLESAKNSFLVSNEHIEIVKFNRATGVLTILNHAAKRNGTYQLGCRLEDEFEIKLENPYNKIQLGGVSGKGTVSIIFEQSNEGF